MVDNSRCCYSLFSKSLRLQILGWTAKIALAKIWLIIKSPPGFVQIPLPAIQELLDQPKRQGIPSGALWFDYDNDGDSDLLVLVSFGHSRLLKNLWREQGRVEFVDVSEQNIMDCQITTNRNGHIACTHGGESLAGLLTAKERGIIGPQDIAILDSTAHALKFTGFQEMYFTQQFPQDYNISPNQDLINAPVYIHPQNLDAVPVPGKPLTSENIKRFVEEVAKEIATMLELKKIRSYS